MNVVAMPKKVQAPRYQPTGTIGLATRDMVYSEFALNLARLEKPKHFRIYGALNYDLAHARNFMVENFEGEYLWLMDDDHTFEPDILNRLLAHNKDIVGPLVLHRKAPFPTAAERRPGQALDPLKPPGLHKVAKIGGAGALIHRRVFEAIEPPWFWHGRKDPLDTHSHVSDDQYFCEKVREAGFDIYVDTSVQMGHMTICTIHPDYKQNHGRWLARADIAGARTWFAQE